MGNQCGQSVVLMRIIRPASSAYSMPKKMQAAFYKSKSSLHTATSQISDDGGDVRAMRPLVHVSCPQEQSA